MFKKALSTIGLKKIRSITSVLLAICLTAVMLTGITVLGQANASSVGKMLEVYNTSGSAKFLEQQIENLPAGDYVLSAYFKNEGQKWVIQAQTDDNNATNPWRQVPGRITTESEDKYLTTIEFTTTATHNFRVRFIANAKNTKIWLANVTLYRKGETENLLTNGDFSDGTTNGWNFKDVSTEAETGDFSEPIISDIPEGFFDKPTEIAPPSGKMVEVYNSGGKANQLIEKQSRDDSAYKLTPGTYKLSAYFKHEGGWKMQVAIYDGGWKVVSDAITESEDKYHTTITFTVNKEVRFSPRFVSPDSKSKLWIADVSVYHVTGGDYLGSCRNYVENGDFTDSRNNGMANWAGLVTNDATKNNAKVMDVPEGFFDKEPEIIAPPSGNMLEVYSDSANKHLEQRVSNLPAGTYVLTTYYKHEGDANWWNLQVQIDDNGAANPSNPWRQVPIRLPNESKNKYCTTIKFRKESDNSTFRVRFISPEANNKLWLANVTLCREGDTENLLTNGDFTDGINGWTFKDAATNSDATANFSEPIITDIPEGFFDKDTGIAPPSGQILEVNNESGLDGQLLEIESSQQLKAGTYKFSAYYKHEGGWKVQAQHGSDDNWTTLTGATVTESEDLYHTTIIFTLTADSRFNVAFYAPEGESKLWLENVSLHLLKGELFFGSSTDFIINGDFSTEVDFSTEDHKYSKTDGLTYELVNITEDRFFAKLSKQEIFEQITKVLCKEATQAEYPESDFDNNGTTDIVDLLLVEKRILAEANK